MAIKITERVSSIGLFRHDIADPEHLVATSIARHHLVNDLLQKLSNRGTKKSGQNHLFIGPRGIGKTHLLNLLEQGLNSQKKLRKKYSLIRFPEESHRILCFADLLLGVIDRLADVEDGEQQKQWRALHSKLEIEDKDELIIDTLLPRIKYWHKQTGKVLIIMLENLDVLFSQQIKNKKDIHRIRSLLMDNSHILLIGTAPTFFTALNDVKHPLYDFFDIQVIEELNQSQTLALIKAHLEWDNQQDLLQHFEQLKPSLLTMYTLTGGNPRLIMMLYKLITQDVPSDIITYFHQLLDRITPLYQDRIKGLSPQERALLETIAFMRDQQRTPVNIATKFRKPRQQTSVLLKRMTEAGYLSVSPHPNDKRSRLYRIKEGFFDIWLAMNGSPSHRKHIPFLVNFLVLWYASQQERENKRQQLTQQFNKLEQQTRKNAINVLENLTEASSQLGDKQQVSLELAEQQLKPGEPLTANNVFNTISEPQQKQSSDNMCWMHNKAMQWSQNEQEADVITYIESIIKDWQVQRSGELEQISRLFHELNLDFSSHGLHQLHIVLLKKRLTEANQKKDWQQETELWLKIAASEKTDGKLSDTQKSLEKALKIAVTIKNKELEGAILNNISQIHLALGDYETALNFLVQSQVIQQKIGDTAGLCVTLLNIGDIYRLKDKQEEAIKAGRMAYKIAKKTNLPQSLNALENLAGELGLKNGLQAWELI